MIPVYEEPLLLSDGRSVPLSIHIATYAKRDRPETTPAAPLEAAGPIIWRGVMETGYWTGAQCLKAPEDTLPVQFHYEQPYQGEIDIQLHMGLAEPADRDDLRRVASSVCDSVLAMINLAVGEFLVPVAPLQVCLLGNRGWELGDTMPLAVKSRPTIEMESTHRAANRLAEQRASWNLDLSRAVGLAARRLVTAQTETDPIDKYCDLWECCEFATLAVKAKGGRVGRIAEALTSHWNEIQPRLRKADVERALEIKKLHEIRGRIVHEALDAPAELTEQTALLESIACEVLGRCLGLPFSSTGHVFDRLSALAGEKNS